MADEKLFGLSDLKRITEASIHRAGPRYTPALDPNAPNLRIAPLVEAFDALTYSGEFKVRLLKIESELREAWSRLSSPLRQALAKAGEASVLGAELLKRLRTQPPGSEPHLESELKTANDNVRSALWEYEAELDAVRTKHEKGSKERQSLDASIEETRRLGQTLAEQEEFVTSTAFRAIFNNRLFLRGSWGTGKTHLLCDIAHERIKLGQPTLLILAQTLPAGEDPLRAVVQSTGLGSDVDTALQVLNDLGEQAGGRALILVDAINEGDRVAWHEHLDRIASLVGDYPNVGLALSCRTPFDKQILKDSAEKNFAFADHMGFIDVEFDAQDEFFRYYDIPSPQLPLLAPEFSTPLFLKILCESIANLSRSAKMRRIKSFASGHKGMTKLLEDFVGQIGANIEKDFGLTPKACWRILKGHGDAAVTVGFAPKMAELMDDQIPRTDAVEIVSQVTKFNDVRAMALIARMANEGLLSEDSRYMNGAWLDTIRLPYQRFSDHLISRHLLARHLDVSSTAAIRNCFRPTKPLGRIFKTRSWGGYEMPGIVSAVMLEFPERVKRAVHKDRQELAFYIPTKLRSYELSQPFIEGLLWRDVDSFSKQTDKLVGAFLNAPQRETQESMLEALVGLASRPDHRYSADRLRRYLGAMEVTGRDLFWSEFLRAHGRSAAAYRVLDWVQRPGSQMEEATARNLITLISLFLTSNVRPFRDRATHCLVILGERFPDSLFAEVSRSFAFNDPYVRERMLAAAYGVLMRQWASAPDGLRAAALPLARELRDRLAGADDTPPIEHVLMRDYAQGFIELTARLWPSHADELRAEPRRVSSESVLRRPSRISEKSVKGADDAIHMDFGNYTIGRLVPGRSNYDYNHKGYRAIRRQIERRILDLGYDAERFRMIDRTISDRSFYGRQSSDGQKTDRYGKKYSWIAYFEVAGRLALRGRLPRQRETRVSDTDIDPSFPAAALMWKPPLPKLFSAPFTSAAGWLEHGPSPHYHDLLVLDSVDGQPGPWVLLEGYLGEGTPNDHRQTFTFLRGAFVTPRDIRALHGAVNDTEYPGNRKIPEPREEYYLFAGEIGWSDKYGQRKLGGMARPDVSEAFDRSKTIAVTKRYGDMDAIEKMRLLGRFRVILKGRKAIREEAIEPDPDHLVTVETYEHVAGVKLEVPVRAFSWESHHSEENQGGGATYPSPAMVDQLRLRKRGPQIDMFDEKGQRATIYRVFDSENPESRGRLFYMRADLVEDYLRQRKRSLVWLNWGEREMHSSASEKLRDDPTIQAIWGKHTHIHKAFFVYDPMTHEALGADLPKVA
ncbi:MULTISPECIES: hypothetical protein [unclassified Phenylobacterium]|uniref:hypothetical protein n=1 Tax=unclassified Phenylobacterium TaxID=2640670 RepID=UPI0012E3E51F|nr:MULTISPECIES: hypothetical protein [unclassified Phenylobacterium]